MTPSRIRLAAALVAAACMTPSALAQVFDLALTPGFVADDDADDGFDMAAAYEGASWAVRFVVPEQGDLELISNAQNQGGSYTVYVPVEIAALSYDGPGGSGNLVAGTVFGQLLLWDRADSSLRYVRLEFELDTVTTCEIHFVAAGADGAYGDLFTVNTPEPNTLDADFVPLFATTAEADTLYHYAEMDVYSSGPGSLLGGLGYINTVAESLALADVPCSVADFAMPYGTLDFFDVADFLAAFSLLEESADIVHDGAHNIFDITAFLHAFSQGCAP